MNTPTPFPYVICPTENCDNDITHKFNRLRAATFNIVQRRYAEIRKKVEGLRPRLIESKTLKALTKHDRGDIFEKFDIKCNACKKRHYLRMNTFTGEVTNSDGTTFMSTVPQSVEVTPEIIPNGNIGPDFQEQKQFPHTGLSPNCPLVFVPDHEFIGRYPQGVVV